MGRFLGLVALGLLGLTACGPVKGDLRPNRAWREVEKEGMRAYVNDVDEVQLTVSDLKINDDGTVSVRIWIYPRDIHTGRVEAADFRLIEADGTMIKNAAGARKTMITRSRPEPFDAVFEVFSTARLRREGCILKIPVIPLEPVEGIPIIATVRFRSY